MAPRLNWERSTVETAAIVAAVLVCLAFIVSFVVGLGGLGGLARAGSSGAGPEALSAGPDSAAGRVEVLNASGRSGLARHVTSRLRDDGFDVVFFGNAPASAGDSSVVLDRTRRDGIARDVARALEIDSVRVALDSTLFLDATVILGVDWSPTVDIAPVDRSGWQRALDWIRPGG